MNNVEYDVRHRGDHFFIEIRDQDRPNSEVLVAPVSDPTQTKVPTFATADGCELSMLLPRLAL